MIYLHSPDVQPDFRVAHVKRPTYLEPELLQTMIQQQRRAKTSCPKDITVVDCVEPQKGLQHPDQLVHLIPDARLPYYLRVAEVLRHLCRVYPHLLRHQRRRYVAKTTLLRQPQVRQVHWQPVQRRLRYRTRLLLQTLSLRLNSLALSN